MAKLFILLALVAVAVAKPMGIGGIGGIGSSVSSHHSTAHVVQPHLLGLGMGGLYGGLIGYPGIGLVGQSISSHSIAHHTHVPHYGIGGLYGKGFYGGLYPGGIGMGYGMIG
ncbi:hypothetical protein Ocin01_13984 [Orchesella cincta]|uniref:Uncharacterized protein n=1 Tax=Orchesella cincta TaxID=48709 RepID=A0A1D2MIF0_ORCCI|nr:hypothetical protein Ocin01_13984 [Orchesella cincta]